MSVFRRLMSEAGIYGLTPLLSSLVGLLLVPIYTRAFAPADYGAIALVNTSTTFASILVVFGLDNSSAIWFWDKPDPTERKRTFSTWLAYTLLTSLVLGLGAVALQRPLSRWLFQDESFWPLWPLFAANLVALNVPRIGIMWYRMQRSPWPAVLLGAVSSVGTAAFGILFVVGMRLGVPGVIGGQAVGSWLGAVIALAALRHVFSTRAVDTKRLGPMLRLSAPLVLMTQLSWVMGSAVSYVVNFLCSPDAAGLYQLAACLSSLLGLVMFAFQQPRAPFALSIPDVPTARRVYGVTVEASFVVGLVLAFAAAVFAKPALLIIARPEYVRSEGVLAILALNTALANIPAVISVTFAREKATMPLAKATAGGAIVTVALLPLLASGFGKIGAAVSVVVGTTTILVLTFVASQRTFPIQVQLGRIAFAVTVVVAALVTFFVSKPAVASLGLMLAHAALLVASLMAAVGWLYRKPLASAWRDSRAS